MMAFAYMPLNGNATFQSEISKKINFPPMFTDFLRTIHGLPRLRILAGVNFLCGHILQVVLLALMKTKQEQKRKPRPVLSFEWLLTESLLKFLQGNLDSAQGMG